MLTELCIVNFALIKRLELSFGQGFNVLTGETGAGKSIIVGAVNLILGSRAQTDMIRDGSQEAEVQAAFSLSNMEEINNQLETAGLPKGDELIIRRVINRSGRNRIYINGTISTLAQLTALTKELVSVSGQHEHQLLLDEEHQLLILDRFGGLLNRRAQMTEISEEYLRLKNKISAITKKLETAREKGELLSFQKKEIEEANLEPGEDKKLEAQRTLIRNAEKIFASVKKSYDLLYNQTGSASELLDIVRLDLAEAAILDTRLKDQAAQVEDSYHQVADAAQTLNTHLASLTFDPQQQEEVEERLSLLARLKKKYGPSLDNVMSYGRDSENQLSDLADMEKELEDTAKLSDACIAKGRQVAEKLSRERKAAAKEMSKAVELELQSLGMPHLKFCLKFKDRAKDKNPGPAGWDELEFLISPNLGEDLKPLSRIASGGELSRTLLGLKALMAGKEGVQTLIFDEVDAGIGGGTATVIGQKIAALSKFHQVLCITHMPQIAAFSEHHHMVYKEVRDNRTVTDIRPVSESGRMHELARMMGGADYSDKTLSAAKEMVSKAVSSLSD